LPSAAWYSSSDSGLTEIPHADIGQDETSIELANNQISQLYSTEFSEYSQLKYLYLQNNPITDIHPTAFNGCPIQTIDLSETDINKVPEALLTITSTLQNLDLYDIPNLNNASVLYDLAMQSDTLQSINLSGSISTLSWCDLIG
jgi:Leucine-rich repeat (LRR) protein